MAQFTVNSTLGEYCLSFHGPPHPADNDARLVWTEVYRVADSCDTLLGLWGSTSWFPFAFRRSVGGLLVNDNFSNRWIRITSPPSPPPPPPPIFPPPSPPSPHPRQVQFGSPYPGKTDTAVAKAALPISITVCSIFVCPDYGMAASLGDF